jgi:hypothetical protein
MKHYLPILLALLPAVSANAEDAKNPNYCHDKEKSQEWAKMIADYPNDPIVIKLAGLREGLCMMIDRGQITLEQGVDLWEDERQKSVVERRVDDVKKAPKFDL